MAIFNLPNYLQKDGFGMSLNIRRGNPNPLDNSSVWASLEAAKTYAKTDSTAYVGQVLTVVTDTTVNGVTVKTTTAYVIDNVAGDLKEIGSATEGDNNSIILSNGALQLVGFDSNSIGTLPMVGDDGKLTWKTLEDIGAGDGNTTYEFEPLKKGEGESAEIYGFKYRVTELGKEPGDWTEIPFDVYTKSETDAAIKKVADLVGVPAEDDESTDTLYERIAAEVLRATTAEENLSTRIGVKAEPAVGEPGSEDYKEAVQASGVYAYVDGVVEALVNGVDPEKIDSLNELIAWVEAHPTVVEGLDNRLEKVEGILEGFGGEEEPETVKGYIDAHITEADGKYATKQEITDAGYAVASNIERDYAKKATTLAGYGITDAYTKTETNQAIEAKITEINGGESAGEVLGQLNTYKQANDTEIYGSELVKEWTKTQTVTDENGESKEITVYEPDYSADSRIDTIEDKLKDIEAKAEVNAIETITVNGTAATIDKDRNVDITIPTKLSDLTDDISHVSDVVVKAKQTNGDGKVTYESKLKAIRNAETNVITLDDGALQDAITAVNDSAIKAVAVNGTPLAKDEEGQVNIIATTGSANGTIAINKQDIAVKGLGSAAYMVNTDVIKSVDLSTGNANGTIHAVITNGAGSEVFNADVAVKGLGTAAYHAEGDFKTIQTAVADPTATAADGTTISYIDSITQNANGVITPTKKTFDLAAFVKPIEDEIDALEPRVKANEDAIKIINGSDAGKSMRTVAREEALRVETAAMEFMGTISELPTGLTEADKGHFYKAITDIETHSKTVGAGDYINKGETKTYNLVDAPVQGRLYIKSYSPEMSLSSYSISLTANFVDESGEYGSQTHTETFNIENNSGYIDYDFSDLFFGPYSGFAPNVLTITGNSDYDGAYCYIEYICLSATDPIDLDTIKKGDSVVWNGHVWYVIPSGDDSWRPVTIAGTALTNVESLAIVAGNKIEIERNEAGAFVINAIAPDIPLATLHQDGALVALPGLIKPVADKFEVEEGVVTKISTDLLVEGENELILYGGNAGTGITA